MTENKSGATPERATPADLRRMSKVLCILGGSLSGRLKPEEAEEVAALADKAEALADLLEKPDAPELEKLLNEFSRNIGNTAADAELRRIGAESKRISHNCTYERVAELREEIVRLFALRGAPPKEPDEWPQLTKQNGLYQEPHTPDGTETRIQIIGAALWDAREFYPEMNVVQLGRFIEAALAKWESLSRAPREEAPESREEIERKAAAFDWMTENQAEININADGEYYVTWYDPNAQHAASPLAKTPLEAVEAASERSPSPTPPREEGR